jgi:hypothetical protein
VGAGCPEGVARKGHQRPSGAGVLGCRSPEHNSRHRRSRDVRPGPPRLGFSSDAVQKRGLYALSVSVLTPPASAARLMYSLACDEQSRASPLAQPLSCPQILPRPRTRLHPLAIPEVKAVLNALIFDLWTDCGQGGHIRSSDSDELGRYSWSKPAKSMPMSRPANFAESGGLPRRW